MKNQTISNDALSSQLDSLEKHFDFQQSSCKRLMDLLKSQIVSSEAIMDFISNICKPSNMTRAGFKHLLALGKGAFWGPQN